MSDKMVKEIPSRSEIAIEDTWNAESLFANAEAWQAGFKQVSEDVENIAAYRGKLGDGPDTLHEFRVKSDQLQIDMMKVFIYGYMSFACDTSNQEAAGMAGQVQGLMGKVGQALAFINPELIEIGQDTLNQWMQADERIAIMQHLIDDLFRGQAHVRSEEVEAILGMLAPVTGNLNNTYDMLVNTDVHFAGAKTAEGETVEVGQSNYRQHLDSADRELRRTAYHAYTDQFIQFSNTIASNLNTSMQSDVFRMQARKHASSLEASLFANKIPTDVFHNLVSTVQDHYPVWQRYWDVKRRALGQEDIQPYDIWAPIGTGGPAWSFEEAVEVIAEGMAPLGEDYVNTLRRGCLEERWVDRYPNKGKQQGAFSFGYKGTFPIIKMAFVPGVASMSTLAHELGHSMHSYLTWENQPVAYSNYSLFAAEVASNFNQALVRAHLLNTVDDPDTVIAVIEEAMANFHRYYFVMPILAQFELEMHERAEKGQPLTASVMNAYCADLFAEGYGDTMGYDRARIGTTWATFQHLYSNFYVYQYATGIAGAHALAQKVLDEGQPAVDAYLTFLKAGGSRYPIDALRDAGVDLSTPDSVKAAFEVMRGYIDRLEALIS